MRYIYTLQVVQMVLNTLLSIASAPLSQFLWTSFCFKSLQQRAPTYFSWKSRLFFISYIKIYIWLHHKQTINSFSSTSFFFSVLLFFGLFVFITQNNSQEYQRSMLGFTYVKVGRRAIVFFFFFIFWKPLLVIFLIYIRNVLDIMVGQLW